jgi:hypothetical protein
MVRASRVATGAAFHDLANATYSAQGSISYGWYDEKTLHPWLEVEIGVTIDSGLFNGEMGDSLEERFWTAALRAYPFTFETWNDQLNTVQPMALASRWTSTSYSQNHGRAKKNSILEFPVIQKLGV